MTKKRHLLLLDIAVGALTIALILGSVWLSFAYRPKSDGKECAKPGASHQVEIAGDSFKPAELDIRRCDRVIINNRGDLRYDLNFGSHDNHVTYPGFSQQYLSPGEYFELDALQAGNYTLHDHIGNKAYLKLRISE